MFHSQSLCNNTLRKLQLHSTVPLKQMIPNRPHARLTGAFKGSRRLLMHYLICGTRDHTFQPNPALSSGRTSSIIPCHIPVIVHTEIATPTVTIDSAHDANTGSWQYVVADPFSKIGVIIDPILDFDENMCTIGTNTADRLLSLVRTKGYLISRILETHTHTDHFSASSYIQTILERDHCYRPLTCIGKRARQVRQMISQRYSVPANMVECTFDELLDDDGSFTFGCLRADVVHLPGHTSDHVGFVIEGTLWPFQTQMLYLLRFIDAHFRQCILRRCLRFWSGDAVL